MTVHNDDDRFETDAAADADLILRTRSGDGEAFGELWRRHYPSGMAVARSVTSTIDPDDLVQESYTRIYQAILKGGGPNGSFRAYLFTSIRNTAAAWGRARRESAMDDLETVADPDSTEQATNEALDRGLTAQAFRSLPSRWQEVLWYTEIERMKPAEVAPLLGMKAGGVSQLAFRAREGLREAWIQAHLRSTSSDSECHWSIERLGAYSRGNLSARDQRRIDRHLEGCARCVIVASEAKEVSSRLALVLLPLVLGVAGAAGYASALQSASVPVVAVAAMPSSVIAGGVVVSGAGAPVGGLTAGAPGAPGAAASGTGSAGGAGASGGAITGIGALVGAGSAALVVAGVVAAAAIVPGLIDANPVTSLPSAGDSDSSSISSEVAPDGTVETKEKPLLKVPEETPKQDDSDTAPETDAPAPETPPDGQTAPPSYVPGSAAEDANDGGTGVGPTQPTNPGGGGTDPGETDPGETDPGETDPGETDPGDGGDEGETTDPDLPVGAPTWSPAIQTCLDSDTSSLPVTVYSVPLSGAPNATVRIDVDGVHTDSTYTVILDDQGHGTAALKPTFEQIALARWTPVSFTYVFADLKGESADTTLRALYSGKTCFSADLIESAQTPAQTSADLAIEDPQTERPQVEEPLTEEPVAEHAPAEQAPAEQAPATQAPDEELPAPAEKTDLPAEDTAPAE